MFGIIDDNNRFILLDDNYNRLRTTALLLAKKTENGYKLMFDEETVDEAIIECTENNTENLNDDSQI